MQIGDSGSGKLATNDSGEAISGTPDTQGQFKTALTSGTEEGSAYVRAELLVEVNQGYELSIAGIKTLYLLKPKFSMPLTRW